MNQFDVGWAEITKHICFWNVICRTIFTSFWKCSLKYISLFNFAWHKKEMGICQDFADVFIYLNTLICRMLHFHASYGKYLMCYLRFVPMQYFIESRKTACESETICAKASDCIVHFVFYMKFADFTGILCIAKGIEILIPLKSAK